VIAIGGAFSLQSMTTIFIQGKIWSIPLKLINTVPDWEIVAFLSGAKTMQT
jgi:hypothetical protein